MKPRLLMLVLLLSTGGVLSGGGLSVCDVLRGDPTKLNGSIVSVRGVIEITDEGKWLVDDCSDHLVTQGVVWPNALWLTTDDTDERAMKSLDEMWAKLRRMHANLQRDRVWVTFTGHLRTRGSMDDEVYPGPNGRLVRVGFGHLGAAPAEIIVEKADGLVVEHKK